MIFTIVHIAEHFSYLDYPFKNRINELLGLRTESGRREPINTAASLDYSVYEGKDGDVLTLLEVIADNSSLDFIDRMEHELNQLDHSHALARKLAHSLRVGESAFAHGALQGGGTEKSMGRGE